MNQPRYEYNDKSADQLEMINEANIDQDINKTKMEIKELSTKVDEILGNKNNFKLPSNSLFSDSNGSDLLNHNLGNFQDSKKIQMNKQISQSSSAFNARVCFPSIDNINDPDHNFEFLFHSNKEETRQEKNNNSHTIENQNSQNFNIFIQPSDKIKQLQEENNHLKEELFLINQQLEKEEQINQRLLEKLKLSEKKRSYLKTHFSVN